MKHYFAVCCIIKDEDNLEEFIIYNIILGASQIYIYDNESKIPIKDRLLHNFFFKKYCTVINFPGKSQQMNAYNHCIKNYKSDIHWLAVIDGDEYIVPKQTFTLTELLQKHEDKDAIGINWFFFGTSYHNTKQNGLIIDKYRHCENDQDRHIKVICKPDTVNYFNNPHIPVMKQGYMIKDIKDNNLNSAFNHNYTTDIVQINHYTFKSLEECNNKHYRGNADSENRRNLYDQSIHNLHNHQIDDFLPNKYMNLILSYISMIAVNNDIYRALNPDLRSFNNTQCYEHLLSSSIRERRPMHIGDKFPQFDRSIFRNDNPQLAHMNDLELELHYIYSQE
uniref:Uncharacterized protein n=1 Tax=viral metagenome TaxID=1070528 RepID=A0A6C0B915_9ZZZZ